MMFSVSRISPRLNGAMRLTTAIAAISGFERVLVYRFDPDGCGDVIGESLVPDWSQSFLGLRFPDTDIPAPRSLSADGRSVDSYP